jgi:DNA-binding transcriptional regulator LsrR (DeoR family)
MTTEAQWGSAQLMTKVALLYHEGGMRQSQIAERLHLSQPTVSRLLSRARAAGIVRTSVVPPAGIHSELEDALQQAFGLLDAVVVDDAPAGRDPDADLGARASAYLQATLSGVPILGISSWSATLLGAASALSPAASDARRAGATGQVVQLVGGHGDPRVQAEAARLLTLLADAMGARPVALPAPGALASRAARDALIADPALAPVVALWSEASAALVGIGSIAPSPLLRESGNAWGLEDQAELSGRGAVGDICQRFIDAAGSPVASDLDERVVGIDLETFRRIPRRVAVAGGETKVAAIRAALRGGWINVLVTNLSSAQALVV